ncbi:hypothetical protein CWI75_11625 [Kineobactrum sediminis]|uniref:DUF2783 domain-containing protein n=1 Tax=Kineobactrum sediminis TaxID=1905677 RepID=A0A2N5Y1Y3_9GAMM|nr:DUF2783 domain-containing protein [Kineobactrum sediminis]PLW82405.1 hypothetical protein CWI75_11625 [Kineobactrum sediminis]
MSRLITDNNFTDPDAFYAALANLYRDRSETENEVVNARLILLLANQVGDQRILQEALSIAGQATTQDTQHHVS